MTQPHIHSAAAHRQSRADFREKQRATIIGALVNLPLALVKVVVGVIGHSQSLVADGVHSAADLISDALVLAAVRMGIQQADTDHPYGHARIETAATTLVSLFLLIAALLIGYEGAARLFGTADPVRPSWMALAVAAASLALKEALFWYTLRVARQANSKLIEANAWHHRSDALSSIAALIAIAGAMLGYPWFDAVGAIVIAFMLGAIGVRYGYQSFRELVDTGLDPERLQVVRDQITTVPGVRHMRRLRTRTMGGHDAFADVGVFVDPYISLTEAHRISEAITARLVKHVDEIADICVHIEPDGHADADAAFDLPLREQIMPELERAWNHLEVAGQVQRVTLHYLDDLVEAEVHLPLSCAGRHDTYQAAFDAIVERVSGVARIRLLYAAPEAGRGDTITAQ
ncbi:cation diffusion facilitator family transporter [Salinisphaera aquimarina]|uniref:Cation diffusion facilitator family transporter n=1 Tax=Salinisphaera aquimarina TaxID=2094031 RepID=A0ABV7EV97_9GAMM